MLKQFTRRALTGVAATAALTTVLAAGSIGTANAAAPGISAGQSHAAQAPKPLTSVFYDITVYTGDLPSAGTDGDVEVRVNGTAGSSGWLTLDNSADNFERNSFDDFFFTLPNLGTLRSVDLSFSPAGPGPDWYLGYLEINGAFFSHYGWLSGPTSLHIPQN